MDGGKSGTVARVWASILEDAVDEHRPAARELRRKAFLVLLASLLFPVWFIVLSQWLHPRPRATLPRVECHFLAFSPDSKSLVTAGAANYPRKTGSPVGSCGSLQVWDVGSGREILSVVEG